jgi:beta-1,2-mannosidase
MKGKAFFMSIGLLMNLFSLAGVFGNEWQLGPFERLELANPILTVRPESLFLCPIQKKELHWESDHIFNPGAVVREGKVYLIYRAEDNYGTGIGNHTSRLGLAVSNDGINFNRRAVPILFPDNDDQISNEFPGGCEDPRIVETEDGRYVMTYTQWNRQVALLAIASSRDLVHWQKHGYAFDGKYGRHWSKSGSIVCRRKYDKLIAAKILGKYWMYWGEGSIHIAISDDLIHWEPILDDALMPLKVLETREGKFDSALVECGPPAIITKKGILLLYNGKNAAEKGDSSVTPNAYSAGQALFELSNPTKLIKRSDSYFLTPERSYEMKGQYAGGTIFIEGLVHFKNKWFLYYGTADSAIGGAVFSETFPKIFRLPKESRDE